MKILRVIGAFFVKIGRWIANTAWVQPLLIVGGIFGIIFSIPYIKKAIEDAQVDNTDYKYLYYSERSLSLTEGGRLDTLLGYLENFEGEGVKEKIKKEYGTQFMLAFVQKECPNCKECVEGFQWFAKNNTSANKFKLYTVLVDKTGTVNGKTDYLAKYIVKNHQSLFDDLAAAYGDNTQNYPLYINKPSVVEEMQGKIKQFTEWTLQDGEGIETPTIFTIDVDKEAEWACNGVTEIVFNYTTLIKSGEDSNDVNKGIVLRDMWTYYNDFNPDKEHQN